jgi:DNA-binding ferritin-like protein
MKKKKDCSISKNALVKDIEATLADWRKSLKRAVKDGAWSNADYFDTKIYSIEELLWAIKSGDFNMPVI